MLWDVEIEISNACNRSCSYCPRSLRPPQNYEEMSDEVFKRIIAELVKLNFKGRLCYHLYNEPLLSPFLENFVAYAKEQLPQASSVIFTNGILLTQERLESLVCAGVKFFIVTKHEGVESLPLESYWDHLADDLKKKIYLSHHQTMNKSNRGGTLTHLSLDENLPLRFPCHLPSRGAYFAANGDLLLCFDDYDKSTVLGNIMREDLQTLRSQKHFQKLCQELSRGNRTAHKLCLSCSSKQLLPL